MKKNQILEWGRALAGAALLTFVLGGRPLRLALGGAVGVGLEALVVAWVLTDRGRVRPPLLIRLL